MLLFNDLTSSDKPNDKENKELPSFVIDSLYKLSQ